MGHLDRARTAHLTVEKSNSKSLACHYARTIPTVRPLPNQRPPWRTGAIYRTDRRAAAFASVCHTHTLQYPHAFGTFSSRERGEERGGGRSESGAMGSPGHGDAAERDIDDLPRNDANYTALTPLWFLERAAVVHPDRAAVVHGPVRYTWAETYRRCRRLASALAQRSVGPGCTVNFFPLSFFFLPATSPVSAVKFYPFFYIKKKIIYILFFLSVRIFFL